MEAVGGGGAAADGAQHQVGVPHEEVAVPAGGHRHQLQPLDPPHLQPALLPGRGEGRRRPAQSHSEQRPARRKAAVAAAAPSRAAFLGLGPAPRAERGQPRPAAAGVGTPVGGAAGPRGAAGRAAPPLAGCRGRPRGGRAGRVAVYLVVLNRLTKLGRHTFSFCAPPRSRCRGVIRKSASLAANGQFFSILKWEEKIKKSGKQSAAGLAQ